MTSLWHKNGCSFSPRSFLVKQASWSMWCFENDVKPIVLWITRSPRPVRAFEVKHYNSSVSSSLRSAMVKKQVMSGTQLGFAMIQDMHSTCSSSSLSLFFLHFESRGLLFLYTSVPYSLQKWLYWGQRDSKGLRYLFCLWPAPVYFPSKHQMW